MSLAIKIFALVMCASVLVSALPASGYDDLDVAEGRHYYGRHGYGGGNRPYKYGGRYGGHGGYGGRFPGRYGHGGYGGRFSGGKYQPY